MGCWARLTSAVALPSQAVRIQFLAVSDPCNLQCRVTVTSTPQTRAPLTFDVHSSNGTFLFWILHTMTASWCSSNGTWWKLPIDQISYRETGELYGASMSHGQFRSRSWKILILLFAAWAHVRKQLKDLCATTHKSGHITVGSIFKTYSTSTCVVASGSLLTSSRQLTETVRLLAFLAFLLSFLDEPAGISF